MLKALRGLVTGLNVGQQTAQGAVDDHVKSPVTQGLALPLLDLLWFPQSVVQQNEVIALTGSQLDLAARLLSNKILTSLAERLFQAGLDGGRQFGPVTHQLGDIVQGSGRLQVLLAQNIRVGGQHQPLLAQEGAMA